MNGSHLTSEKAFVNGAKKMNGVFCRTADCIHIAFCWVCSSLRQVMDFAHQIEKHCWTMIVVQKQFLFHTDIPVPLLTGSATPAGSTSKALSSVSCPPSSSPIIFSLCSSSCHYVKMLLLPQVNQTKELMEVKNNQIKKKKKGKKSSS